MENKIDVLMLMEDVIFLKKDTIFSGVQTEDLKAIAAIGKKLEYADGEIIVKEGDAGDSLFIIKDGSIRITKNMGSQKGEIDLAVIDRPSCFGEMVIFEDAPRSANAYAHKPCVLLKLKRDDLMDVMMQYPRIAIELFKVFGKRLRENNDKIQELSSKLKNEIK